MPNYFYKLRHTMSELHLVLVTLHGPFTISIEQDNGIGDNEYILFSVL